MKMKKDEKKSNTFCKFCEKTFSQRGTLNRHIDSVHNGSRNFKCLHCDAVYMYKHHLQRHMDSKHPTDPEVFICDACLQECSSKDHMRRHIFSKHMNEIYYECDTCRKRFPRKDAIQKHVSIHMKSDNRRTCTSICPLCREVFLAPSDILNHFECDHQLQLLTENHEFEDLDNFISWKTSIEKQLYCAYRRRKIKPTQKGRKEVYGCHRSGYYVPRQCRKRRLKLQGSKKINGFCPSKITVRILDNGVHKVEFMRTHIGHPVDVEELAHVHSNQKTKRRKNYKSKESRTSIPTSVVTILGDISVNELEYGEKDEKITTPRDVLCFDEEHLRDMIAVEVWVMENSESVLFYKRPFEEDLSQRFGDEDFLLVIMTEVQLEKFKEECSEIVLVDGTNAVDEISQFFLHTVMVIDSTGEGYPCCVSISNRKDAVPIELMFACIKEKLGTITTRIFMSDMQQVYFDVWIDVMESPPEFYLYCTWHLMKMWENQYSTSIRSEEKKTLLRERMHRLLIESDLIVFHQKLEEFLQNNDEELQTFISHFIDTYLINTDMWARCYYQHANLTENISLKKFHQALNYTCEQGYVIRRVPDALNAIDIFLASTEAEKIDEQPTYSVNSSKDELMRVEESIEDSNEGEEIVAERIHDNEYEEEDQEFFVTKVVNEDVFLKPITDKTFVDEIQLDEDEKSIVHFTEDADLLKKQFNDVIEASVSDPRKLKYIEEMFQKLDRTLESFDISQ